MDANQTRWMIGGHEVIRASTNFNQPDWLNARSRMLCTRTRKNPFNLMRSAMPTASRGQHQSHICSFCERRMQTGDGACVARAARGSLRFLFLDDEDGEFREMRWVKSLISLRRAAQHQINLYIPSIVAAHWLTSCSLYCCWVNCKLQREKQMMYTIH